MIRYAADTMEPLMILMSKTRPIRTPDFYLRHLLLVLLSLLTVTASSGSGLLALDTARAATTVGGGESEVNVLLGVKANHVGRHVDDLLADTVGQSRLVTVSLALFHGGPYRM
jgi:hypothetical protein